MIKSFKNRETKRVYHQQFSKKLPTNIQGTALRKLILINTANDINDLRMPPGNHLEKLTENRKGEYSIKINNQYRICFKVKNKNEFHDVEITDYH